MQHVPHASLTYVLPSVLALLLFFERSTQAFTQTEKISNRTNPFCKPVKRRVALILWSALPTRSHTRSLIPVRNSQGTRLRCVRPYTCIEDF